MLVIPYDGGEKHYGLVDNENQIDVVVALSDGALLLEKESLVCQSGRRPPPALLEELVEFVRAMCGDVCRCTVIQTPSAFEHEGTKPTIFTCLTGDRKRYEKKSLRLRPYYCIILIQFRINISNKYLPISFLRNSTADPTDDAYCGRTSSMARQR